MAQPFASDHLQDVYEVRGRLEYPELGLGNVRLVVAHRGDRRPTPPLAE